MAGRGAGLLQALWLAGVFLLAGCGFQPRGTIAVPPADMQPVFLAGLPESSPFMRELRNQLSMGGVALADRRQQAASVLFIKRLAKDRRVFSVDSRNKVAEYEIVYRLNAAVQQPPGTLRRKFDPIVERRIIYDQGGQILSRVRETELREKDVYKELARRLIHHLASL